MILPAAFWTRLLARRRLGTLLLSLLLFGSACAAGAAATSPVLRSDPLGFPAAFLQFMSWQAGILEGVTAEGGKVFRNVLWLSDFALRSCLVFLVPPSLWIVWRTLRKPGEVPLRPFLLSGLVFPLALTATLIASRDIMRENDMMYVFPFLIVLSGFALGEVLDGRGGGSRRRALPAVLPASALASFFFVISLLDSLAFARPDTRLRAVEWSLRNMPSGSVILRDRYALPVARDRMREERYRYLVDPPASGLIEARRFDYVVSTSLSRGRFFDPLSAWHSPERQEEYRRLLDTLPVLAVFSDRPLPFNHPTVTVYGNPAGTSAPDDQGQR